MSGQIERGRVEIDIPARHAQVIGQGPRYTPLAKDELGDEALAMIQEVRQMFNIPDGAHIPEVSLITLRHPGLFRVQMQLGLEVAGKSDIPHRERELIVLRIAQIARAPFEWSEHVSIGKRFGLSDEEIERVKDGSSAPGWSEHDAAVLRAVEELMGDYCVAADTWDVLAKSWSDKALMEFPMLVGNYVLTAYQQNSLRIPLEPGKTGLDYR